MVTYFLSSCVTCFHIKIWKEYTYTIWPAIEYVSRYLVCHRICQNWIHEAAFEPKVNMWMDRGYSKCFQNTNFNQWKYHHLKVLLLQRLKLRIFGPKLWSRASQEIQDWEVVGTKIKAGIFRHKALTSKKWTNQKINIQGIGKTCSVFSKMTKTCFHFC